MPLISVIVPVYNAAAYIEKALVSVLCQLPCSELEVICIDDGSTDESACIIRQLATSNDNITLFSQANSGPAVARNMGLKLSRGRYVAFLDADDYLVNNAYKQLLRRIIEANSDVIFHGYKMVDVNGDLIREVSLPNKLFQSGLQCFRYFYHHGFDPSACFALYDSDFLKHNALRFPVNTNYEDAHFFRDVLARSVHTIIISDVFYAHVQYEQSRSKTWNLQFLLDYCELNLQNIAMLGLSANEEKCIHGRIFMTILGAESDRKCRLALVSYFKKELDEHTKLIIYGIGSAGNRLASILMMAGFDDFIYCTSDSVPANSVFGESQLISVDELSGEAFEERTVILGSSFVNDIYAKLEYLGFGSKLFIPNLSSFKEITEFSK
jgi:glycosyltransferase involved in cell wall biosynthesis